MLPGIKDLDSALKNAEERDTEYFESVRGEDEKDWVNACSHHGIDYTPLWGTKVPPKPTDADEDDKHESKLPHLKPQPKRRGKSVASKVAAVAQEESGVGGEEDVYSHRAVIALLSSVREQLSSSASPQSGVSSIINLALDGSVGGSAVPRVSPLWLAHRQLPIHSVTPLAYMRDDFEAAMRSSVPVADPLKEGHLMTETTL